MNLIAGIISTAIAILCYRQGWMMLYYFNAASAVLNFGITILTWRINDNRGV